MAFKPSRFPSIQFSFLTPHVMFSFLNKMLFSNFSLEALVRIIEHWGRDCLKARPSSFSSLTNRLQSVLFSVHGAQQKCHINVRKDTS